MIYSLSPPTTTATLDLLYRADLFQRERAQHILQQLHSLLQQLFIGTQPNINANIGNYPLVLPNSSPNNGTIPNPSSELDATWEGCITDHFHRVALQHPHRVAVIHGDSTLTYNQLDNLTSQLANALLDRGLSLEDGVFIWSHRNVCIVWAILGALKAGGSVSLMDPIYPNERIINCLKVAQPKVWISIEEAGPVPQEVLDFLPSIGCTIQLVLPSPQIAKERRLFDQYPTELSTKNTINKETIAVVTFTSGSTGLPKAVLGRHGPLTHFYPWMRQRFQLSENDHFSMCSGISHDPLQR